jgi:hypothetical protein
MKRRKSASGRRDRDAAPRPVNPKAGAQRRRQLATHHAARYRSR